MTAPIITGARIAPTGTDPRDTRANKLQNTARQLEGVFVLQMLKAMRATVPKGGVTEASNGEETFTSMLDQKIADKIPAQWKHGLTDALTKQLVARDMDIENKKPTTTTTTPAPVQSK
jgi:Rod binding domain-containing protein